MAQKAGNTVISGVAQKAGKKTLPEILTLLLHPVQCAGVKILKFCKILLHTNWKRSGEGQRKTTGQKDAI